MKFVYPVDPKNGNDKFPVYLKGASNLTGYYPIGRMNTWHGGIHYEGNNPLKAISDGKIIAYRVPEKYYEETINNKTSKYSNGFVLIQHHYKSPDNKQELTFYSLYNHLSSFEEMEKKKFPNFLTVDSYVIADNAKDITRVKGVTIKAGRSGGLTLAVAPKGTVLTFEEEANNYSRRKVKYITPNGKEIVGYTWIKEYKGEQLVDVETGEVLSAVFEGSNGDKGANLREEANSDSAVIQLMPRGTSIEVDENDQGKTGWLKVKKVGGKRVTGYCHSAGLSVVDVVILKKENLNKVISNECYEVKAGEIIGYAGLNGFEKKEAYRGAHVEVFTPDDVTSFLNYKGEDDKNKNFAKLTEGTELKKKMPLKLIKNLPVKKTGKTFEGYTEVEIDNLEVVVMDRYKELPTIYNDASKIYTFSNESNSVVNAERLNEFNKVVGDIAQMGDNVWLKEQLQGKQRRVIYQNPNKGQIFWVKNEDLVTV